MKNLIDLFKTKEGRILVSILWGIGLATIFRKTCSGRACIVYKAPDPKEITSNVYGHNGKCYKYSVESTKCTKDVIVR